MAPNHEKVPFLCVFTFAHGVQVTMGVTPSGVASTGARGAECPPDSKKLAKNQKKEGKNWEKEGKNQGKIGKKTQNLGRFFHFAPSDR